MSEKSTDDQLLCIARLKGYFLIGDAEFVGLVREVADSSTADDPRQLTKTQAYALINRLNEIGALLKSPALEPPIIETMTVIEVDSQVPRPPAGIGRKKKKDPEDDGPGFSSLLRLAIA